MSEPNTMRYNNAYHDAIPACTGLTSFPDTAQITSVTFSSDGNQATFTGNAKKIRGKHSVTFTVSVLANQQSNGNDTLTINVSDGYSATGKCLNGAIFIAPNP